jgi:hypothetical protein
VDRYQPFGCRHFRPVADRPICPALRKRDGGKTGGFAFSMPILTACGADGLP